MKTPQQQYSIAIVLGILLVCLAGVCAYQYLAAVTTARAIDEQRWHWIMRKSRRRHWLTRRWSKNN